MKSQLLFLLVSLFFCQKMTAQSDCSTAVPVCGTLDGLVSVLPDANIPQAFAGCPANVLNNPLWYAFVATDTVLQVRVKISNCQGLNGLLGMQGAIMSACDGNVMANYCPCTSDSFDLFSNEYVPGNTYYLVLDGCGGDICEFELDLLQGSTEPVPPSSNVQIQQNSIACPGDTVSYYLDYNFAPGVTYHWILDSMDGTFVFGPDFQVVSIVWNDFGQKELCVELTNICGLSTTVCDTVLLEENIPLRLDGVVEVCENTTGLYWIDSIPCGDYTYNWYIESGTGQFTIQNNLHFVEVAWSGSGGVLCLEAVEAGGDTLTECIEVETKIVIADAGDDIVITCDDTTTAVTVTGTSNIDAENPSYTWTYNGTFLSNSPIITITNPGIYVFSVFSASTGCSDSDTLLYIEDVALPIADAGPSLTLTCLEPVVLLDGSNSSIGGEFIYTWFDVFGSVISTDISVNVSSPGVYHLLVEDTTNHCFSTDLVAVTEDIEFPELPTSTLPDSCNTGAGVAAIFLPPAFPPYSIIWSTSDTATLLLDGLTAGQYSATITVGVCEEILIMTVDSLPCVSVFEKLPGLTDLRLLPNPNNGEFDLSFTLAQPDALRVDLLEASGRVLKLLMQENLLPPGNHLLHFEEKSLATGLYYLLLSNRDGSAVLQVIIE